MKATKGSVAAQVIAIAAAKGTLAEGADQAAEAAKIAKRHTLAELEDMLAKAQGGEVPSAPVTVQPAVVPLWLVPGARAFLPAIAPGVSDDARDGLPAARAEVLEVFPAEETARVRADGETEPTDVGIADLVQDQGQPLPDGLEEATDEALVGLSLRWGIYHGKAAAKRAGRENLIMHVREERAARKLAGWAWDPPGVRQGLLAIDKRPKAPAPAPAPAGNPMAGALATGAAGLLAQLGAPVVPAGLEEVAGSTETPAARAASAAKAVIEGAVTTLTQPVAVVLLASVRGGDRTEKARGTLNPDGSIDAEGNHFANPGAAHAHLGTKDDPTWSWEAWRLEDGRPIARVKVLRGGRTYDQKAAPRARTERETLQAKLDKARAEVARLEAALQALPPVAQEPAAVPATP
jgi:hypothetical protein